MEIQPMPNKTIYVSEEDAPVWDEAKRLLRLHHDEELSSYITPFLQEYIADEKAFQRRKKD
jgi:hypothetical protein